MTVRPSTVWNGVDRNISSARSGYGSPPGQRVEPDQRPEEQAADRDQVHVDQLVHHRVLQREPVEAGEVQRERAGDEEREGDQREGEHLGDAAVQHPAAGRPRAPAGRVRSASVTGAPSARKIGASIDSTMCWTMCTESRVVSYASRPLAVTEAISASPTRNTAVRPSGPPVASGPQAEHAPEVERGRGVHEQGGRGERSGVRDQGHRA